MIWFLSLLLAQASSVPEQPTGPWTVSTKDDGCQVVRDFGSDKKVHFGFETLLTSRRRTMLFVSSKKALPEGVGSIGVRLDDKDIAQMHYGVFELPDPSYRLIKVFPDDSALSQIAKASVIAVGDRSPPMQVRGIDKALGALDKCSADLLSSWGADPTLYLNDKMAGLAGNPGQWFTRDTYPKEARAKGASGRVVLLLMTNPDGTVERCKAVASEDHSLDAGTCAIAVQHVKLKPPIDDAGNAMASYSILPVRWARP